MIFAEIIVYAAFIYLAAGALFAVWFAARGTANLDDSAKDTGFGFRLIIFFGAVAFWVLLARRVAKNEKRQTDSGFENSDFGSKAGKKTNPRSEIEMIRKARKTHKIIWLILAFLLPLIFIASIVFRHHEPVNENVPPRVVYR